MLKKNLTDTFANVSVVSVKKAVITLQAILKKLEQAYNAAGVPLEWDYLPPLVPADYHEFRIKNQRYACYIKAIGINQKLDVNKKYNIFTENNKLYSIETKNIIENKNVLNARRGFFDLIFNKKASEDRDNIPPWFEKYEDYENRIFSTWKNPKTLSLSEIIYTIEGEAKACLTDTQRQALADHYSDIQLENDGFKTPKITIEGWEDLGDGRDSLAI